MDIGWNGAIIGNIQNADLYLSQESPKTWNNGDYSQKNEAYIEICVKYEYGQYWLLSSKMNQNNIYVKTNNKQMIFGDDIIQMGALDFLLQRFNVG